MALPKEFWEELPQKSDAELYDILAHEEDYLPEALAAAKEELSKRNLVPEKAAALKDAAQSQKSKEDAKAQEPLSWLMRFIFFFFCAGLVGALFAVNYSNQGYKKKASDCWVVLAISMVSHLLLGGCVALQRG